MTVKEQILQTTTIPKNAIPASEILEGKTKQGIALTFELAPTSKKAERAIGMREVNAFFLRYRCVGSLIQEKVQFIPIKSVALIFVKLCIKTKFITAKKNKKRLPFLPHPSDYIGINSPKSLLRHIGGDMACAKTTSIPKNAIPASEILEGKTKRGIALTFELAPTSKKAERATNPDTAPTLTLLFLAHQ